MIRYLPVSPANSLGGIPFFDGHVFESDDRPLDLASDRVFAEPAVAPYLHVPRDGGDGVVERVYPRKPRNGRVVAAERRWGVWCWVVEATR